MRSAQISASRLERGGLLIVGLARVAGYAAAQRTIREPFALRKTPCLLGVAEQTRGPSEEGRYTLASPNGDSAVSRASTPALTPYPMLATSPTAPQGVKTRYDAAGAAHRVPEGKWADRCYDDSK
jgi:hypothetical protein